MRRWRGTVVGRMISIMRGGDPASRLSVRVFFLGFPFPFLRVLCIGVCGFFFSFPFLSLSGQSAHSLSLRLSSHRHHPSTYSHSSSSCSSSSAFYHLISISHASPSSHRRIVSISYARSSQHTSEGRLIASGLSHLASISSFLPLHMSPSVLFLSPLAHTQSFVYHSYAPYTLSLNSVHVSPAPPTRSPC